MKHNIKITILLVFLFFVSQVVGLGVLAYNAQTQLVVEPITNESSIIVVYEETAAGPRPEVQGYGSLLYIAVAVALGTLIILGLIKLKLGGFIWKAWYFLAVTIAIAIAMGVFIPAFIAFIFGAVLAFFKLYYKHPLVHNFTEILMYAGIALLLVPLFSVLWAFALLVLISLYDMYAVWKSKHMIRLANFTTEQKLFPGLALTYSSENTSKSKVRSNEREKQNHSTFSQKNLASKKTSSKTVSTKSSKNKRLAILGGGDIIFPLLFTGTILNSLLVMGFEKLSALSLSLVVSITTAIALYLLLYYAKKDRFYPAMPFVSAGCVSGFFIVWLLLLLL
jgi:presenilin-like A22 family membrane protease